MIYATSYYVRLNERQVIMLFRFDGMSEPIESVVVMDIAGAKSLMAALKKVISKWEDNHGEVKEWKEIGEKKVDSSYVK